MKREVVLETEFGRLLTLAAQFAEVEPRPLEAHEIEEIEEEFSCRIPDPILGYFAARLAGRISGGKPTKLSAIRELTLQFRDLLEDEGVLEDARYNPLGWVMFEEDDSNYLGFPTSAKRDEQTYYFFDQEGTYTDTPIAMSLSERLRTFIQESGGDVRKEDLAEVDPLAVKVRVREPEPTAEEEIGEEINVTHPKFGAGRVVRKDVTGKHEKWEIEFESGEKKLLLARFLEVQD